MKGVYQHAFTVTVVTHADSGELRADHDRYAAAIAEGIRNSAAPVESCHPIVVVDSGGLHRLEPASEPR